MTHSTEQEIAAAWNAQADELNRWDVLDLQEKIEWAAKFGKNQAARRAQVVPEKESIRECAMCNLSYANGMLDGWNRCVADDDLGFERHRSHLSSEALKVLKLIAAAPQPPEVNA